MNSINKIKAAFDNIHAEDKLKADTLRYLSGEAEKRTRGKARPMRVRIALASVSLAALFVISVFFVNGYYTAAAFVDMDINPSLELSVNRFGRVIDAYAYNEEGSEILASLNLRHIGYQQAVRLVLSEAAASGYLRDDALLTFTIQTGRADRETQMLTTLESDVAEVLSEHHAAPQLEVFSVSADVRAEAHTHHLSPAKYLAILELQKVDPAASVDACRSHSIGEIREFIQEREGSHHGGMGANENAGTDSSANCDEDTEQGHHSNSNQTNGSDTEHHDGGRQGGHD